MIGQDILTGLKEMLISEIKEMDKIAITNTIAPNAIERKNARFKQLEKEEDTCIDQIIASQSQFLNEFHTAAKGDWVDAAKQGFESVQKALEAIK